MHHQDTKDHQTMSQTSFLCESLKKFTQLALSFSLFSLIFLHPSLILHSIHYIMSLPSKNPSQLLSAVTDKKYIFLLCNGILVFIAKYSSRTVKNQPSTQQEMMSTDHNDLLFRNYLQPSLENATLEEYVVAEEEKEEDVIRLLEAKEVMPEEELQEEDTQFLITDGGEREEDDDDEGYVREQYDNESYIEDEVKEVVLEELQELEQEEEEEEEIAEISTEELNRKFEEFIRKMKEELRIEAQQQLIMSIPTSFIFPKYGVHDILAQLI
ncbi:hypothetical protein Cgig2_015308 [Carnegiea gigantea]|uniref:Uncharacterized protein n=1 Tax=Carnegiea gigantea TaxID=171969 RepID=A0A9Q1JR51_9CARY|nr:hypothetical protein Cgig2_015308 [Carnegiea gigantea]